MTKIDKKIIDIIDLLSKSMTKNNLSEIEISNGSSVFKLKKLVKESNDSRNNEIFEQSISKKTDEPSISEKALKSPLVGTAYLSPEPGAKKFVTVGDKIKKGQTVMIVEAMKTMNHVPSTSDGEVKSVLVEDGQPVEFGQTLVLLK